MHEPDVVITVDSGLFCFYREMGTRAAAFSAKIKSLRELQAKVGEVLPQQPQTA